MVFYPLQLALGILLSGLVALTAYRLKFLSSNGSLSAFFLGSVVFGLGGLRWAIILLVFFLTSSGLSRLFRGRKEKIDQNYAKGSTRDAGQVLANGGLAGLFVMLHFLFPSEAWTWIGFCAAFAAANADTWATEIGALASKQPRLITTMKVVQAGTSGAVSILGTLAAFIGALLIGLTGALVDPFASVQPAQIALIVIIIGGVAGSLVDSLLGATLQAIYRCPQCQKDTEKTPLHGCGTETSLVRGIKWLNNDMVNFLCNLSGTASALLVLLLLTR
jgi:uncharacterized protein (TIGR00297 family)